MRSAREFVRKHDLVIFFVLVFCLPWLHAIPEIAAAKGFGWNPPSSTLKVILRVIGLLGGPMGSAALLTGITRGRTGLREWISQAVRWRVAWPWYVVVLFTYPVMAVTALVAADLISGSGSHLMGYFHARVGEMAAGLGLSGIKPWLLIPLLILEGVVIVPLYEEPGWRGFVLPRFQEKHGALCSGVMLGIIWAFWHLPNFFVPGTPHYGMPFVGFLISIVALSVLMTAVYNSTKGSVLLCMLLHGSIIVGSIFFPAGLPNITGNFPAYWISVGMGAASAIVVTSFAGPKRLEIPRRIIPPG